jgi:glycerate kinase
MRRLLAAFDTFRGSISATDAGRAAGAGAADVGWQTVVVPLADGGEGRQGKVVGGVFALAPDRTSIVAGQVRQPHPAAVSLLERFGERAWTETAACIAEATRELLSSLG